MLRKPPHDDIKDALASVIEIAVPPMSQKTAATDFTNVLSHPRFGGLGRVVVR